jgi:hypothetical protein
MLEGRKKNIEIKRVEKNKVEDERKKFYIEDAEKKYRFKKEAVKRRGLIEDLVSDDDDDVETVKRL